MPKILLTNYLLEIILFDVIRIRYKVTQNASYNSVLNFFVALILGRLVSLEEKWRFKLQQILIKSLKISCQTLSFGNFH